MERKYERSDRLTPHFVVYLLGVLHTAVCMLVYILNRTAQNTVLEVVPFAIRVRSTKKLTKNIHPNAKLSLLAQQVVKDNAIFARQVENIQKIYYPVPFLKIIEYSVPKLIVYDKSNVAGAIGLLYVLWKGNDVEVVHVARLTDIIYSLVSKAESLWYLLVVVVTGGKQHLCWQSYTGHV